MLTALQKAMPRAPVAWLESAIAAMAEFDVNTARRQAHFLGQLAHESSQFTRLQENLDYQAPRLVAVWPKRFATINDALPYEHNPQKLANRVYADRLGNRDESSGDGWKYRGRGPIQITGHDNYSRAGAAIGLDLVGMPDLAIVPHHGARIAGWFWRSNGCNPLADQDALEAITIKINGATLGLEGRGEWVAKLKDVL